MKKLVSLILLCGVLAGCSTMQPPRYSVSTDNVVKLREFKGREAFVSSFTMTSSFEAGCRLMGPIEPADGLSVPMFVAKAMNDEFKMAEIYSENGASITGNIDRITFSSMTGLTNGYWDIAVTLTSSTGAGISVENRYNFKSGFDAITACNATADALTPAVQDLIQKVVNHPQFPDLLK